MEQGTRNTTQGPSAGLLPSREKFWGEIEANEKIERIRSVLKNLVRKVERMENIDYNTRKLLLRHSHNTEGHVVQAITELEVEGGSDRLSGRRIGDQEGDNVYF